MLAWFRTAQACRRGQTPLPRLLERFFDRAYRELTTLFMATDIHPDVVAGPNLTIFHCQGIVLNPASTLGAGCVLRAGVCLGNRTATVGEAPDVRDGVEFGAGAMAIGAIVIGRGARVGAGAVVLADVPAGASVVGNPGRIVGSG